MPDAFLYPRVRLHTQVQNFWGALRDGFLIRKFTHQIKIVIEVQVIPLIIASSHTIPFIQFIICQRLPVPTTPATEGWDLSPEWWPLMPHWMSSGLCKSLAASHWARRKYNPFLTLLGISTTTLLLLPSVRWIQSMLPRHFPLITTMTWPAILLYDYCLTFAAEVERCWSAHRLNWALGFFYLNRYLTLFGHVPIMIEFFWSTSNPNKIEVSISLPKGPVMVWGGKYTDAQYLRC